MSIYVSVHGWTFNAQLLLYRIQSNPALKGLFIQSTTTKANANANANAAFALDCV